jgi:hypothetical protein
MRHASKSSALWLEIIGSTTDRKGPMEGLYTIREDLGWYNAIVVAAVFEAEHGLDFTSVRSFIGPLRHCVEQHAWLTAIVKDGHTDKPFFEGVTSINLENHIDMVDDVKVRDDSPESMEKVLPRMADKPFPTSIPPWRIFVFPFQPPTDLGVSQCLVGFAYSHSLGDGINGLAFHRTFLDALQKPDTANDVESSTFIPKPGRTLPPPFDIPGRLPISWSYLLSPFADAVLPTSLVNLIGLKSSDTLVNANTWTGSPYFHNRETYKSQMRIVEIPGPAVSHAIRLARSHDAKLTAVIHHLILRGLDKAVTDDPAVTNFVSQTAISMRPAAGVPIDTPGFYLNAYSESHPRSTCTATANRPAPLSRDEWAAMSAMSHKIAEATMTVHDQPIGLLRFAPSMRRWLLDRLGRQRTESYEVSNLGAFDGQTEGSYRISKMVFGHSPAVSGCPVGFSVVSVRGGSLVLTVTWLPGALGMSVEDEASFVDAVCESIRDGFEALGDEV